MEPVAGMKMRVCEPSWVILGCLPPLCQRLCTQSRRVQVWGGEDTSPVMGMVSFCAQKGSHSAESVTSERETGGDTSPARRAHSLWMVLSRHPQLASSSAMFRVIRAKMCVFGSGRHGSLIKAIIWIVYVVVARGYCICILLWGMYYLTGINLSVNITEPATFLPQLVSFASVSISIECFALVRRRDQKGLTAHLLGVSMHISPFTVCDFTNCCEK